MKVRLSKPSKERLFNLTILIQCVFLLLFISTCRKKSTALTDQTAQEVAKPSEKTEGKVILQSSLAGTWYSADVDALKAQIEAFFQKADSQPEEDVIALILPHAGYAYSGQTAVMGVKTVGRQFKRIIVIGPSHRLRMEEILSVPRVTHYQTPLGEIPLDVEFINKLLGYSIFQNVPAAHSREHSVQIELPLLQYVQRDFTLVPIVAGQCSLDTVTKAAEILKGLIDEETLVVASSDFVHYGQSYGYVPFTKNVPEKIKELDMGAYEFIAKLDSRGFLDYKAKTGATICGYVPIAILLSMLDKDAKSQMVKYTTSGELTGDFERSVSYLSVAFLGQWGNYSETQQQTNVPELSGEDKQQLLTLARKTIDYVLRQRRMPEASELGVNVSDAMKCPRAAFVTLKKNGQLRGCIGDIFPQRPLYRSVMLNAVNAGFSDRRFLPLSEAEYDGITIEISALTAPEPVASYNQIRIGIDGVVLNKDGHSAVFLPQVAPEQGWDLSEMLTQLSRKARLADDAWKEGASFLVFQADVFGEEE